MTPRDAGRANLDEGHTAAATRLAHVVARLPLLLADSRALAVLGSREQLSTPPPKDSQRRAACTRKTCKALVKCRGRACLGLGEALREKASTHT
jgi:hypothetical protein